MSDFLWALSAYLPAAILAITLHEAAHGWAAWKLGDDTALQLGRVTLNPLRHVDPVGTVILPGVLLLIGAPFLFGWAKPVPVNFARLRPLRLGMALVAAAGPGINLVLALICAVAYPLFDPPSDALMGWARDFCVSGVLINCALMVLNLIPLPPLDGGRIVVGLAPAPIALAVARFERAGLALLIAALFLLPLIGGEIGVDLGYAPRALNAAIDWAVDAVRWITGA